MTDTTGNDQSETIQKIFSDSDPEDTVPIPFVWHYKQTATGFVLHVKGPAGNTILTFGKDGRLQNIECGYETSLTVTER